MAISKEHKQELLAQYEEAVRNSRALLIAEYRGLSTANLGKLREAAREANGTLNVVKLTLLELALKNAGLPAPKELLTGPLAVGFCHQEVPAMAKAFKDFVKEFELASIKGGIMGNRVLSGADVETIADLPPLEVIRARLMGIISAPARNVAGAVAGGVRQVINVLNAYAEKDKSQVGAGA